MKPTNKNLSKFNLGGKPQLITGDSLKFRDTIMITKHDKNDINPPIGKAKRTIEKGETIIIRIQDGMAFSDDIELNNEGQFLFTGNPIWKGSKNHENF